MTAIEEIKAELNRQLSLADPNVGIAFGESLFLEFKKRGLFTLENFGLFGTTLFGMKVPAYERTHYAFLSWDIGDLEFKVGGSLSKP